MEKAMSYFDVVTGADEYSATAAYNRLLPDSVYAQLVDPKGTVVATHGTPPKAAVVSKLPVVGGLPSWVPIAAIGGVAFWWLFLRKKSRR
jgi:hypothetical protein